MSRSPATNKRRTTRKKQHLKIVDDAPELDFASRSSLSTDALSEDLEGKAALAMQKIEEMQRQQLELMRHREELEEINLKKQEFLSAQGTMHDRLNSSISLIEREVFEMKQEIENLQRTRDSFALHLERIDALDYRSWAAEELSIRLDEALSTLDRAEDDYMNAYDEFRGSRANVFNQSRRRVKAPSTKPEGQRRFIDGVIFHAPLLFLGAVGIFVYLFF